MITGVGSGRSPNLGRYPQAILLDPHLCISYSSVASIKNLNGTFKRSREIIDQYLSDKDRYVSPSQTSRGPVYMLKSVTVTILSMCFMGVALDRTCSRHPRWATTAFSEYPGCPEYHV